MSLLPAVGSAQQSVSKSWQVLDKIEKCKLVCVKRFVFLHMDKVCKDTLLEHRHFLLEVQLCPKDTSSAFANSKYCEQVMSNNNIAQ